MQGVPQRMCGCSPSLSRRPEGAEILATLQGLEDEIAELQTKGDKLKKGDLSVEDLEEKLQKRLHNWKKHKTGDEVPV